MRKHCIRLSLFIVLSNLLFFISVEAHEGSKLKTYNNIFELTFDESVNKESTITLLELNKEVQNELMYINEYLDKNIVFYNDSIYQRDIIKMLNENNIDKVQLITLDKLQNEKYNEELEMLLEKNSIDLSKITFRSISEMMFDIATKENIKDICVLDNRYFEKGNEQILSLAENNIFAIPYINNEDFQFITEYLINNDVFNKIYTLDENDNINIEGSILYTKIDSENDEVKELNTVFTFLNKDFELFDQVNYIDSQTRVISLWDINDINLNEVKDYIKESSNVYLIGDIYSMFDAKIQKDEIAFLEEVIDKLELEELCKIKDDSINNYDDMYVVDLLETERCYIYSEPSYNSSTIGYIYGDLQEIIVLEEGDAFSLIQVSTYGSLKPVKGYIPTKLIKKADVNEDYIIVVDKEKQMIFIYSDDKVVKEFVCSTGKEVSETPSGRFLIGQRGYQFGTSSYTCYDWIRFNYNYLFHSVLCYPGTRIPIPHEYDRLGNKASDGCIRVKAEEIKWMYDNIPSGTMVIIK